MNNSLRQGTCTSSCWGVSRDFAEEGPAQMTKDQDERYVQAMEKIAEHMPRLIHSLTSLGTKIQQAAVQVDKKKP